MTHKIMTVYGTRPEAIKMAPLVLALREDQRFDPIVAVTGQHREMLDQVNSLFGIRPNVDMNLMAHGASLEQITSRTLEAVAKCIAEEKPDAVVVQGDTTSALAGALAAFYHRVPVVHLEAGLRTGNMSSPFPEEANRRLVAPLAALHLAPTSTSRANLQREGIAAEDIVVTGNTVIDALKTTTGIDTDFTDPQVADALNSGRRILLVTAHRRESWGNRMTAAMSAVADLATGTPDLLVLLPMHKNPVVRTAIEPILSAAKNVVLTEPLSYHEFAHVLAAADIVLTDSGGVQEEAPSLGKPVLVMRDTTERPEAVEAGTVRLVGTDRARIHTQVQLLLDNTAAYDAMATAVNPHGDGHAAERCVAAMAELLGVGRRGAEFTP